MSITITITEDTPAAIFDSMRYLLEGEAREQREMLSPEQVDKIVTDTLKERVADTPRAEPEIVPPKRTRTTKKAETVIQPDVTDIDTNGDPVVADEFAGKSVDEIAEALKPLMIDAVKAKGQDPIFAILAEFKVKNRTEAAKLPNVGKLAARLRAEVA